LNPLNKNIAVCLKKDVYNGSEVLEISMQPMSCAYCGSQAGTTRDHVIPKCLFIEPLPEFMVTVPACEQCHGPAKSSDDEYLRDMLVLSYGSQGHPIARRHANGSTWRAAGKNRSEVVKSLRDRGKLISRYDEGLLVGQIGAIPLDEARVRRIFATMLRGLHYKVTEQILPSDAKFEILGMSQKHFEIQLANWQKKECCGPAMLGYPDATVFSGYYFCGPTLTGLPGLCHFTAESTFFSALIDRTSQGSNRKSHRSPLIKSIIGRCKILNDSRSFGGPHEFWAQTPVHG
jgi:hypothetical protein